MNSEKNNKMFDINLILHKIAVKENESVAELGCGHFGYFVFPLAKIVGKNGRVYAVDILPEVIRTIKKQSYTENLLQIKPVWSNLEKFKGTPIDSSSVDAALLVNVLSQSEKKTEIIRESVRLLKHGGRLLIVDWKSEALLFGPPAKYRLRAEALKQIAPKLSLILIEEFEVGIPYHAFLFKKI